MNSNFIVGHRTTPVKGILLQTALPDICEILGSELMKLGRTSLILQLPEVLIPSQALAGTKDDFSFMAYPISMTYSAVREKLPFGDEVSLNFNLLGGEMLIKLDGFGGVTWLYLKNLESIFLELLEFKGIIGAPNLPQHNS